MGTNYYIKINVCPACKRPEEEIHLGKASFGWQFSFQYNGGKYYKNVKEMKEWLRGRQIWDEYDEKVRQKAFWKMIESKRGGKNHTKECPEDHRSFNIEGYSFTDCEFS